MEDKIDEDPSELPGASAKRLEIAKALSTTPKVLMLDEIFAGLSYEEGEQMIEMLKNMVNKEKLTILLIDHNLRMVKKMVDKTTVINMGEIIAEGSFEEIESRMRKLEKLTWDKIYGTTKYKGFKSQLR